MCFSDFTFVAKQKAKCWPSARSTDQELRTVQTAERPLSIESDYGYNLYCYFDV